MPAASFPEITPKFTDLPRELSPEETVGLPELQPLTPDEHSAVFAGMVEAPSDEEARPFMIRLMEDFYGKRYAYD